MLLSKLSRCVAVSSGRLLRPSQAAAPVCRPSLSASPFTGTPIYPVITPSPSVLFSAGPGADAAPSIETGMKQVKELVDAKVTTEPVIEW